MSEMKKDLARLAPWLGAAVGVSVVIALGALPGFEPEAPAFVAPLVSGPDQGDRVSLEALRGEVVVLDFWASWCPPCVRSIPILNELAAAYEGRVRFYGVNIEAKDPSAVGESHRRLGAQFPSLHDPEGLMQAAYAVDAYPTLFIIDGDGHIRHREAGVPDASDIASRLDELLLANANQD